MVKDITILIVAAAVLGTSGCASLSLPFFGKSKPLIVQASQSNPVMETITLWEPGEGRGPDNLPTRGFAGQVLFFTFQHPTPARVEGRVTVYVFDDVGDTQEQSRPLWQHTFASEEWNALSLQTNLGTAYQIFVPYTRKGRHEAHCSVRVKFEPGDGGPPVYSKMANVVLPGEKSELAQSRISRKRIEPQPFDADAGDLRPLAGERAQPQLRTSTVALPSRQRVSAQSAARLQQLAHEMVQQQQQSDTGIEQAAYFTESAGDDDHDVDETADGPRYRLYR